MSLAFVPPAFRGPLHFLFEAFGYTMGIAVYLRDRRKKGDIIPDTSRSTILCAAAVGAALGARLLALAEHPTNFHWSSLVLIDGGKTIIGGILGGWLAVEMAKRIYRMHVR